MQKDLQEIQLWDESIAVGHRPDQSLSPQDEALFRAFQANLLSLISHELRTPLMGVLNALTLLEENLEKISKKKLKNNQKNKKSTLEFSSPELIHRANENARRLNRSLAMLLELAALESGTFHVRLREVDGLRLVKSKLEANRQTFRDQGLTLRFLQIAEGSNSNLLADPQKFGRAVDLCIQILLGRAQKQSEVEISFSPGLVDFAFSIRPGQESVWDSSWTQGLAGHQSGVTSPGSAFAGTIQSEQAFLTRVEEGLGSEFLLIHEMMRLHQGRFQAKRKGQQVSLSLILPELLSQDRLVAVLASRASQISPDQGGLSSVALGLIQIPKQEARTESQMKKFEARVKQGLFRSSDSVYLLPERGFLALVMDDCKSEDAPKLLTRLEKVVGQSLMFGVAHCPADGMDPKLLIEVAAERLMKRR